MKIREIITELNVANSNNVSEDKHKELRDIIEHLLPYAEFEERIGIDFITLTKALEDGVYYKEYSHGKFEFCKVRGIEKIGLSIISNFAPYPECDDIAYFKDYGKTWALTQEELEK